MSGCMDISVSFKLFVSKVKTLTLYNIAIEKTPKTKLTKL